MGTIMNFISQHIHIPLSPAAREHDSNYFVHHHQQKQQQSDIKPRYHSVFSDLSAMGDQRERALQQFPCEEKHSFNPHYQHNLISTSPSYSTPPSLSSSLSSSSPSSTYSSSSSSHSSLSRATGARSSSQDSHLHHYNTVSGSSSNGGKHDYSYHRHYNRRQNLRCYTLQQQQEHFHDDWMFGITEDDDYRGAHAKSPSPSTMTRSSPQESPISPSSLSTVSLRSSLSRRSQSQHGNVMNAFSNSAATNTTPRSTTVTFSSVVLQPTASSSLGLLPSISESSLSSLASDNGTTAVAATAISTLSAAATTSTSANSASRATSSTSSSQQRSGAGRLTAKQSLMRISQCSKSEEGWCSQKAGQYTQRYADDSNPRGIKTDGRRTRRL